MFKHVGSRLAILCALAVGTAAGVAVKLHDTTTGAATALTVPYENAEYGIKLTIPASWQAHQDAAELTFTAPDAPKLNGSDGYGPRVTLFIGRSDKLAEPIAKDGCCRRLVIDKKTGRTLQDTPLPPAPTPTVTSKAMPDYAAELAAQAPGAHVVGTRSVGGEEAAVITGLPNNGIQSVAIFLKHRGILYSLTAMGDTQLSAEQEAAIASLQFIDK
jgi:hypothetical protein